MMLVEDVGASLIVTTVGVNLVVVVVNVNFLVTGNMCVSVGDVRDVLGKASAVA